MIPAQRKWIALLLTVVVLAGCDFRLNPQSLPTSVVSLQLNQGNISFDDLSYDAHLDRLIVPAAETGALVLVDPRTKRVARMVEGFSRQKSPAAPVIGTTSAAVVGGKLFALDRGAQKINIVDPDTGNTIGAASLQGTPDYIRYMAATNELWVTERVKEQIEVFKINDGQPPTLTATDTISVPSGPEALVIYQSKGLAFTNQPKLGTTAVIFILTHRVADHWGNGCTKARGMAVDEEHGFLFVACSEGKLVVMDINQDGAQVTSQTYGGGLDFVAYNRSLHHLYLPSATSGILAIFGLTDAPAPGKATPTPVDPSQLDQDVQGGGVISSASKIRLERLGTADTAVKASCVTVDNQNNAWVCDPVHGRLLVVHDSFDSSKIGP